jgi:hypothetical protein
MAGGWGGGSQNTCVRVRGKLTVAFLFTKFCQENALLLVHEISGRDVERTIPHRLLSRAHVLSLNRERLAEMFL